MPYTTRERNGNLSLSNAGHLSLFPMGSGSAFSKTLFQNNLLVVKGNSHLQVDCGTRAPEAFFRTGLPITEVRNFLITHSHADHIGGLEEVILMGRYVTRRKPRIIIHEEYQEFLWNHSLRGGAGWNEVKEGRELAFEDYWDILRPTELPGFSRPTWSFKLDSLDITMFRTMHYPDSAATWKESAFSLGVIIDGRVLFTGDTRFDPKMLEEYCSKFPIELIFHDVQFFPGGVHAPFDDLKTLPMEIRSKIILMHYPDTFMNHLQKVMDAGFIGFVQQQVFYDFS